MFTGRKVINFILIMQLFNNIYLLNYLNNKDLQRFYTLQVFMLFRGLVYGSTVNSRIEVANAVAVEVFVMLILQYDRHFVVAFPYLSHLHLACV